MGSLCMAAVSRSGGSPPSVDPPNPHMRDCPGMVGRAPERAVVDETLRRGAGALVVEGEPGIGKSCLLGYAAETARAAGATVLTGRATEYEGDLPFGPWREALEPHVSELGERRVARLG